MTGSDRTSARLRAASLLAATAFLFAACSGAAATAAPSAAPAASSPAASSAMSQVMVAQDPKLGAHLAGQDGKSLYLLTADSANTATCVGGCATAWPPFEVASSGSVTAGNGVTGALATITRSDDGKLQVTYNGIPLYYYAKDAMAGDINGQGFKGVWFLAGPASTAIGGPISGGVGQGAGAPSAAPSPTAAGGY